MLSILTTSIPSLVFCSSLSQKWESRAEKDFPLPFHTSSSLKRRHFKVNNLFKRAFPHLLAFPFVPPFCFGWIMWCQVSSAAISALVLQCTNRCFQNQCHRKHLLLGTGLMEKCCRNCRCSESSQQWKWFETFALSLFHLPLSSLLPSCWK